MLAGFHLLFSWKSVRLLDGQIFLVFFALYLILKINFSQGLQKGLYAGIATTRIPCSFHKSLTMLAVCILALSTIRTTFELSSWKISVINFLNFLALNVWQVPTMPSTLEEENASIKLILNFKKFTYLKALLPDLLQQYSVLDSDKNLNSSIYTIWKSLLSNVAHNTACVYICWCFSWPSATRLRSPHFLYVKPRLSRILRNIVFCWTGLLSCLSIKILYAHRKLWISCLLLFWSYLLKFSDVHCLVYAFYWDTFDYPF